MSVKIACPNCRRPLRAPRALAGKTVRCARCGTDFVLDLDRAISADERAPAPAAGARASPFESTVSRSMLMPIPGLWNAPSDEMICRLEADSYVVLELSATAQNFLGDMVQAPGRVPFLNAVHPDDRTLVEDELRRAAELGERHDVVLRLRSATGRWRFVRLDAHGRYGRDGRLDHLRCHFADETDRIREEQELRRRTELLTEANEQLRTANARLKETQAQLVHSEKLAALGTLAAGMAHEINNPLAFATNNTAVLERDAAALLRVIETYQHGRDAIAQQMPELDAQIADVERHAELAYVQEHIVEVARATLRGLRRVADIVANLRAFARLDRCQLTEIDPNESLDQALLLLAEPSSRARITVVRDYAVVPWVECEAVSVNQVLFHLLANAVQAVEDGGKGSGTMRLTTRSESDAVVIEVADDGCGIAPEALNRIFDPFFTTKPVGRGTGLGLSISHAIVSAHGGRIEVESAVGVGSRFRVRLPLRRSAAGGDAVVPPIFTATSNRERPLGS